MSKQLLKEMIQYENDLAWVMGNYDNLANEYADNYVAILNSKVIEYAVQIEELQKKLEDEHSTDLSHILIEFIYKEPPNFIL